MAVIAVDTSPEDRKLYDEWSDEFVSGAEVLKDFTEYGEDSKIIIIKKGTISDSYKYCYFNFHSENGIRVGINVVQVAKNEGTYFKKINK